MVRPIIAAVVFFLHLSAASAQSSLTGRVVAIADGDTITVLDASKTQHRVRIAGIDAPERGQPGAEPSTSPQGAREPWPAGQPWRTGAESV